MLFIKMTANGSFCVAISSNCHGLFKAEDYS